MGVKDITIPEELACAEPYYKPKEYQFIAEIGQGMALPNDDDYQIRI
jgi:hypothetical protein